MSTLKVALAVACLLSCSVCTKKQAGSAAPQIADRPAYASTSNSRTRVDVAQAKFPDPSVAKPAYAKSPLKPLAEGKRVRITKLDVPPVEITVPPDFRLRMEGDGGEMRLVAHVEGPGLTIEVQVPDGGFSTLGVEEDKRQIREISPKATFPYAYALEDGSLFIVKDTSGSGERRDSRSV